MEFQTIFTSVRPAKVAIFIDSADPTWQHTTARIIEFLSSLWDGRHSLIVPTDGRNISPEFWTLLSSFDPDYLFYYRKTQADVKEAAPGDYEALLQGEVERFRAQHGGSIRDREMMTNNSLKRQFHPLKSRNR
jgi:hypothetical protein